MVEIPEKCTFESDNLVIAVANYVDNRSKQSKDEASASARALIRCISRDEIY